MWPWVYRYQKREVLATFVQLNSSSSQKKRTSCYVNSILSYIFFFDWLNISEPIHIQFCANNFKSWKNWYIHFLTLRCPMYQICKIQQKFQFCFEKGSSKLFPMSVAPISR